MLWKTMILLWTEKRVWGRKLFRRNFPARKIDLDSVETRFLMEKYVRNTDYKSVYFERNKICLKTTAIFMAQNCTYKAPRVCMCYILLPNQNGSFMPFHKTFFPPKSPGSSWVEKKFYFKSNSWSIWFKMNPHLNATQCNILFLLQFHSWLFFSYFHFHLHCESTIHPKPTLIF